MFKKRLLTITSIVLLTFLLGSITVVQGSTGVAHRIRFNISSATHIVFQKSASGEQVINVKANTGWALMETSGGASRVVAKGNKTGNEGTVLNLDTKGGSDYTLVVP